MSVSSSLSFEKPGKTFIPDDFLPAGKDQYHLRNQQIQHKGTAWRNLTDDEIRVMKDNGNAADNWNSFQVTDDFDAGLIRNSSFYGLVRIGQLKNMFIDYNGFSLPVGITNSTVINCDIGNNVAIHQVKYLAHYIIRDQSLLFNIGEMSVTDNAKFGAGIIKEGENEDNRRWINIMNENSGRKILAFNDMTTADAFLWGKYRDDIELQHRLIRITQESYDIQRGYYGITDNGCVIKNTTCIRNVNIGRNCLIDGADKLENCSINSSPEEPASIGSGVQLKNGIVGYGCNISSGSMAFDFVMGPHSMLKTGARMSHTVLGDNSTIACCEISNNLIFPAHEQHHNNSFLIASVIMGQSNIAAGATIGSNHNSRASDNEIQAGRGFWPGLCTSLKHSCRFASYVLLSKADYPFELQIPLPFSLIINNASENKLEIIPAYWWLYNMYALARNPRKFKNRDKRIRILQNIEFEALAPDTIEEIIRARGLIELWAGKNLQAGSETNTVRNEDEYRKMGAQLLEERPNHLDGTNIPGENIENSKREVVILKPAQAYRAYREMMLYYAVTNLLQYRVTNTETTEDMHLHLNKKRSSSWINLGGQLMKSEDVSLLKEDIKNGTLASWNDIHNRYNEMWANYDLEKKMHAYAVLCELTGSEKITETIWRQSLQELLKIQLKIRDQVIKSREKDYHNTFRQSTFRNNDEMITVTGTLADNSFIRQVQKETDQLKKTIEEILDQD